MKGHGKCDQMVAFYGNIMHSGKLHFHLANVGPLLLYDRTLGHFGIIVGFIGSMTE